MGGDSTLQNSTVELGWAGQVAIAHVTASVKSTVEIHDYPGDNRDTRRPATATRTRFLLMQDGDGWRVAQIEAAS